MIIYIIMQKVDLGGHPIDAFINAELAIQKVNGLNESHKKDKMENLIAHCNYTEEKAKQYVQYEHEYYIEEIELFN